ncbi:hypothetical protein, partial [Citrobacter portucalensis]|uniref:hypothetical protein n=1 Tax=Citrobacter portucalensis TaxID=1639133 RepID=UPI00226B194B
FHGDAQFFNRPGQMSNLIVLIKIGRYTVRLFMGDAGKGVNQQHWKKKRSLRHLRCDAEKKQYHFCPDFAGNAGTGHDVYAPF